MNRSLIAMALLASSAALTATPSFATGEADTYANQFAPVVSQRSRAEVNAEAVAAAQLKIADPSLLEMSRVQPLLKSTLTRAEVLAEAARANRLGLIPHGDLTY